MLVAAVVTAVAGFVANGWFSKAFSQPLTPTATHLRLMQPFDLYGKLRAPYKPGLTLRGGSCLNSSESADAGALRCFNGSHVADPCWQSGNQSRGVDVACLTLPWDTRVLVIVNPRITAMPGASIAAVPWAMEIIQPGHPRHLLRCGLAGGTARVIAGMRANWSCFRPGQENPSGLAGYALGTPKIAMSKPWTVFYVPVNGRRAVETTVTTVWR